jgi:N-acetylglucosaminyl-diphospho-decaprenol L-rhamnosyltransferase
MSARAGIRRIGVVVVTWNSAASIETCLSSCGDLPAIVVDNASDDDTVRRVRTRPGVCLITNPQNVGFAAAANQGIAACAADYVLLLNPDARLTGSVQPLAAACDDPSVAIAAGQLQNPEGAAQCGFAIRRLPTPGSLACEVLGVNRLFPRNPINRRYRCLDVDFSVRCDVEQPAGAFLMFRRELWQRLDGFDEQFRPVWFEDVDFCKRALALPCGDRQMRIRYLPEVTARHQGGASIARLEWSRRELFWYGSLLKYAAKHFSVREFRGVCAAVVLGSALRAFAGVIQKRSLKPVSVYARIAWLAGRYMVMGRIRGLAQAQACQRSGVRTVTSRTK